MAVVWDNYEPFDPRLYRPYDEASASEASAAFDHLMRNKKRRVEQLRGLLARNGIQLDTTDAGLQRLEDWLKDHVEADPADGDRLAPIWYSVVSDIAVFIGDVMIERRDELRWELHRGSPRDALHQWATIGRFSDEPRAVAPEQIVAMIAHRVIAGLSTDPNEFIELVREAETA